MLCIWGGLESLVIVLCKDCHQEGTKYWVCKNEIEGKRETATKTYDLGRCQKSIVSYLFQLFWLYCGTLDLNRRNVYEVQELTYLTLRVFEVAHEIIG